MHLLHAQSIVPYNCRAHRELSRTNISQKETVNALIMVDLAYGGLKSRACESVKLRANEKVSRVKDFQHKRRIPVLLVIVVLHIHDLAIHYIGFLNNFCDLLESL